MNSLEECLQYVERIIRRKTVNYAPDLRDDVLQDALTKMVTLWPRCRRPVTKEYLRKTFCHFAPRSVTTYMEEVHIPQYYRDAGVNPATLDEVQERLPLLSDEYAVAITHAMIRRDLKDPGPGVAWQRQRADEGLKNTNHTEFEVIDTAPTPEKQAENKEKVERALDKLTEKEQDLLIAVFVRGESRADIAKREGVTREAIRQRIKRAKEKIK